jgi:hypothetical protein
MSEPSPLSFFASNSTSMHLLRGGAAAALFTVAVKVADTQPFLSIVAGIGAIIMLRGCPMCWTMGLIATVRQRLRRDAVKCTEQLHSCTIWHPDTESGYTCARLSLRWSLPVKG